MSAEIPTSDSNPNRPTGDSTAEIDVEEIAGLVYQLMLEDLARVRERSGLAVARGI